MEELKQLLNKESIDIGDRYIEFILNLINFLRDKNYNIDITAVINYFKILPSIDIFEYQEMVDVMKTLFAKNKYQYLNLEHYINYYFFKLNDSSIPNEISQKFKNHIKNQKEKEIEDIQKSNIKDIGVRVAKKEKEFIKEQKKEELEYLEGILKDKNLKYLKSILNLEIDEMKQHLIKKSIDMDKVESDLKKVIMENIRRKNNKKVNELCILAGKKIKTLSKNIKDELTREERERKRIEKELELIEKKFSKKHRQEFLEGRNAVILTEEILDKNIAKFNEEEIEYIGDYIRMNANKFKTVVSRSMKKDKRKIIDFKKTMKESIKTFGYPVELYYKKPKKNKVNIMCIMDISGSVKKHSRLLSYFIYEISSVFTGGVKSYAFIKKLEDITDFMTGYELSEGYTRAMTSVPRGYSDYNTAFKMFSENHLKKIDRNIIVIILGDARNNKNKSGIEYLKEIKDRAKSVIWLNPDDEEKWNQGDSIIGKYKPYVDFLYVASTPNQLIDFLNSFNL